MQDLKSGLVQLEAAVQDVSLDDLDEEEQQKFQLEVTEFREMVVDRYDIIKFATSLFREKAGKRQGEPSHSVRPADFIALLCRP